MNSNKTGEPIVGGLTDEQILTEHEAAAWLRKSVHTLRKWRSEGRGPRYVKLPGANRNGQGSSGAVCYRFSDLHAFLDALAVTPSEVNRD